MMATQLGTMTQWQKSLSLNTRDALPPIVCKQYSFLHIPKEDPTSHNIEVPTTPTTTKAITIAEAKRAFLESLNNTEVEERHEDAAKKPATTVGKKISFKIKKTSSIHRRVQQPQKMATISASSVAELTTRFNALLSRSVDAKWAEEQSSHIKVIRKPSLKGKEVVRKRSDCEGETRILRERPQRPLSIPLQKDSSIGTVKATVEKFEKKLSPVCEQEKTVVKPKVPEKNFKFRSRQVKIKQTNSIVRMYKKEDSVSINDSEDCRIDSSENVEDLKIDHWRKLSLPDFKEISTFKETLPAKPEQEQPELPKKTIFLSFPGNKHTSEEPEPPELPKKPILRSESSVAAADDKEAKSIEVLDKNLYQPNTSFLWRRSSQGNEKLFSPQKSDDESSYEAVNPPESIEEIKKAPPAIPFRPKPSFLFGREVIHKKRMPLPEETENTEPSAESDEVIYEKLNLKQTNYEDISETIDGYEYVTASNSPTNNVFQPPPLPPPPLLPRRKEEPLPLPPRSSPDIESQPENVSNCYESIYNSKKGSEGEIDSNYEIVDGGRIKPESWSSGDSNRDSLLSADQQSNSIYGRSLVSWADDPGNPYSGKATSDLSSSDRSDEWQDLSEPETNGIDNSEEIVVVMEKQRIKKAGWSQMLREQRNKILKANETDADNEHDHYYECVATHEEPQDEDFDSFESDTESEKFNKDSSSEVVNSQLPDPPINQTYGLTRLAARANKHMKRLRNTWSVNDLTKSLSRMTHRKKSIPGNEQTEKGKEEPLSLPNQVNFGHKHELSPYENVQVLGQESVNEILDKTKQSSPKGFLHKFRKSITLSADSASELTQSLGKTRSTFYLTEAIDIDREEKTDGDSRNDSGLPSSPVQKKRSSLTLTRPSSPPPPVPTHTHPDKSLKKTKRRTSWYVECGLFKNQDKRPTTFWYAEVGLYRKCPSTPSTTSPENSGTNTTGNTQLIAPTTISESDSDEYFDLKNTNGTPDNETKPSWCYPVTAEDLQLRLQDEPLYQFYDAAVLEDTISDFYSDVEEVDDESRKGKLRLSLRPTAMELIAPYRNSLAVTRTLWCEIPEVINSAVLSSLSTEQKKLQEAKFEMLTSEASYLNSLNVLKDHFIDNLQDCEVISEEEKMILFGQIAAVKSCSEQLLLDLEKCWQDNILLSGVCEILQKHAEEKFHVYISYCENQIYLDSTLRKLKERPGFTETLRFLENSTTCQSLSLYSFLMLPMQRITRWPLLVDAVLKRLSPQDNEYVTCQRTLAMLNKVVMQCNEGARKTERKVELHKIVSRLEYPKGMEKLQLESESRWLIRSGPLTQITSRSDETILTFGKRFIKVSLYLFLFNDMLLVTKMKNEDCYTVLHYCSRNLIELAEDDSFITLPVRDTHGKNMIFVTLLENQEKKTVEFLFSASSESDKERWVEALSPPKSEDPDEILYECWDCPQVLAVHNYVANQPDELSLNKGEIINVTRKMTDGWFHGERLRDGQTGWFPANYTKEVANPHVRARNLRQRYRLLALSENYLKSK